MGGNAAGSFYFVRRLKAAMSCVAATAITASTLLLGLVAVSSVTAPPAAAAASSWTAFVYNLGGFVQPILNVQSGNPTLGTSFNSPAAGGGGDSASGTSVSPDGTYLFASNYGQNSVSVFLTSTDAQVTTLTTKVSGPFDNAVSPDGTELWVANYGSSSLTVFCIASGGCNGGVYTQWQEITNITGSGLNGPIDVAISPNDEYAYAANYNSYTDSVFCANWSGCYGTAAFGAMSFSPMALYGTAGSYGIDWTAFTPDGQYAYVADCGNTACSAQGDLSMIQNAEGSNPTFVSRNTTNGYGTNQVDIAPNCTTSSCTAYVTNFGHLSTGNIQVYTGADSGSFPSLQTTYGNAQNSSVYNPNYFAITPDSNYLIVSDSGVYGSGNSDQVDVFATSSDTVTHILGGSSNYPWTVATQPDQAPTAVLSAYPAGYGQSSFFDGSGSTNPIANPAGGSAIKSYAWNFGNGCTATTTGSQVNFVYSSTNASLCASPTVVGSGAVSTYGGTVAVSGSNTYTVTLTVTNWANTSTSIIYTGHTVSNNGSSLALASKTITLPTKLAVTSSPTSGVTMSSNPNIGPITIQMQTSTGTGINAPPAASGITDTINLAASPSLGAVFSAWNGTSCGSTTITSINVTAGQSSVQVCFGDATAASYTLTFSGSGGASGLTSVTQNITVAANGAYQLDFTTAAMSHICINSGACPSGPTGLGGELGPMTVEVDNAGGTAVNPGSNVNINLSSAGGSGTAAFYTVSGGVCTTTVTTSVSVLTSATSASFCYSYSAPDVQPTITATATSGFPATHGNLAPTQIETIAGPATQIVFTTAAESALYISTTTPNMGPIVVSLEDSSGYVTNATSSVTVNLSSSLSGGTKKPYFCQWSGASCSGASSTPTAAYAIATGGSTLTFGFGYNKGNTYPILTAAATGLTSGTQTETIASGAPAMIVISSTAVSGSASSSPNLEPITLELEDSGGFGSPPTTTHTINLSTTSATGLFSLWTGTACSTTTTFSATISSPNYEATVCYGDTTAGSPQIEAQDSAFAGTTCGTSGASCQTETVTAAAPAVVLITTGAKTGVVSSSANLGAITATLEDQFGNLALATGGGQSITLSSTSSGKVFSGWSGTSCTGSAPAVIAAGSSSASFCYGDTVAGTPTVTVTTSGLTVNSASQVETENASSPYQLVECDTDAATCSTAYSGSQSSTPNLGPVTYTIEDSFGNAVKVASSYTVNLTYTVSPTNATGLFSSWTGTSCSTTTLTSVVIAAGNSSIAACFGDTATGTYTVTGTTSGLTTNSANQTETIVTGVWNQNAAGNVQEQYLTGDWYGVSQLNTSNYMIAVGDNAQTATAYGQVAYAQGQTGTFNVTSVFDGNAVDLPHGEPASVVSGHSITSISCPTSSFCAAVDNHGDGITYNGTSWSVSSIDGTTSLSSVSCATTTACVAVDSAGNAFSYNGAWTPAAGPGDAPRTLDAISCPSTTVCLATDLAGNGEIFDFSTNTWTTGPTATGSSNVVSVSCSTAAICMEASSSGALYAYTGSFPFTSVDATGKTLTSVSCVGGASTTCVAVDTTGDAFVGTTTNSGASWAWATTTAKSGANFTSVSCFDDTVSSAILCGAVDTTGDVSYNNGSAWTATNMQATGFASVSCSTASFCIAGDTAGNSIGLLDNGSAATVSNAIGSGASAGTSYLEGVNCPTTSPASNLCVVVGINQAFTNGVIIVTTDPTNPWDWSLATASGFSFTNTYDLAGVSCVPGAAAASTTCFTVGYGGESGTVDIGGTLLQSTNGGSTWTDISTSIGAGNVPGGTVTQLTGVTCVSSTECIAVGKGFDPAQSVIGGVTVFYGGSTWGVGRYPLPGTGSGNGELTGISCPSASTCFATGNSDGWGSVFADTSASSSTSTWSQVESATSGLEYLFAVGCPTGTSSCYAAGYAAAGTFNGTATVAGGIVISSSTPTTGGWGVAENNKFGESAWFGLDCAPPSGGQSYSCTAVGTNYTGQSSYGFHPVAGSGS